MLCSQLEVKNIGAEPLEIPDADVQVFRLASSSGTPDQTRFLSGGPGRFGRYGDGVRARGWPVGLRGCWKPYFTTIAWGVSKDGQGYRVGHNPAWTLESGEAALSKKAVLGVEERVKRAGGWWRSI